MNKVEFADLIKNPYKLGSEHIETLKKIVADYPYFSTVHILLAKALLNTNHYEYEKQLKHTALIVGDRSVLHQFLYNNNLDIGKEQEPFNVPIELKVEKVSKPDFEIGKEEQDALLNEAQQIIGINNHNSDEIIPQELIIEKNEFHNYIIPENNLSINENIESEVVVEALSVNLIETALVQEKQPTSIENVIESNDEQIENTITDSEIELVQTAITAVDVESSKNAESDFQLTETEGTLVRFTLEDNFLPDFDESSLFIDEQNIETITKSVLLQKAIIAEKQTEINEVETSTVNLTDEIIKVNSTEVNEIKFKPTELIIENSEEQISTFDNLNITENNIEQEVNDDLIKGLDGDEGIEVSDANNNSLTELNAISESEIESHNFIDWLTKNKTISTNPLVELPINKTLEIINYEDVEFTEKIIQILKTKAEFDLSKNIRNELISAHELILVDDKETDSSDLVATDKEEIVESNEMLNPSIVYSDSETNEVEKTLAISHEDEVYEEIESFTTQFSPSKNEVKKEAENEVILASLSETFIPEIYTGEVPSILPDFEALNKIDEIEEEIIKPESFIKYDKKEGLIPDYNSPLFEPILSQEKEDEPKNDLEEEPEEDITHFNSAPINDSDFELVFSNAFEPLPPKIEVKELVENKLQETENTNNTKQDVESILDKFMRENPSITRPKSEFFNPANVAKLSVEEKDEIVSETLASIYLKQGLIKKAILTYEKLSLIYPHKITYFAALINQIKTEHNIN